MTSTGRVVVRPSRRRSTTHRWPATVVACRSSTSVHRADLASAAGAPGPGSRARRAAAPSGVRRAAGRARPRRRPPSTTRPVTTAVGRSASQMTQDARARRTTPMATRPVPSSRSRSAGARAKLDGSRWGPAAARGSPADYTCRRGRTTKSALVGSPWPGSHSRSHLCTNEVVEGGSRWLLSKTAIKELRQILAADSTAPEWRWNVRRRLSEVKDALTDPQARQAEAWLAAREADLQPRPPPAPGAGHRAGRRRARQARRRDASCTSCGGC